MYNGIGLTTPRGSGTNGHVQRNWAFVRSSKKDNSNYHSEDGIKKLDDTLNRPPNKDILDHDRKRKIEVKCLEFEEVLEKQCLSSDEIKNKVDSYRKKLMGQGKSDIPKDEFGRILVRDSHQIAEAQEEKNAKLREAFNISEYFVEGSSFDSDRKMKEDLAKSLALQKELDAQRDHTAAATAKEKESSKRYRLERTPSMEHNLSSGSAGVLLADNGDNTLKKKKKKKNRESSTSPERKKDKKKKSKKRKKESKSKKSKKLRKRKGNDSDSIADNYKESIDEDSESEVDTDVKKRRKKSKRDKKKRRNKKKDRSSSSDKSRSPSPFGKTIESKKRRTPTDKVSSDYEYRSRSNDKLQKQKESERHLYESPQHSPVRRSDSRTDRNRSKSRSDKQIRTQRSSSRIDRNKRHRHEIRDSNCSNDYRKSNDADYNSKNCENRRSRSRQRSKHQIVSDRIKNLKRKRHEEYSQRKRGSPSIGKRKRHSRSYSPPLITQSRDKKSFRNSTENENSLSVERSKTPRHKSQDSSKNGNKSRSRSQSVKKSLRKKSRTPLLRSPKKKETNTFSNQKNSDEIKWTSFNFNKKKSGSSKSRSRNTSTSSSNTSITDTVTSKSRTPSPKRELSEKICVSTSTSSQNIIEQIKQSLSPMKTPTVANREQYEKSRKDTQRSDSRSEEWLEKSKEKREENKNLSSKTPPPSNVEKRTLSPRSSRDSSELSYSPAIRNPERYRDILQNTKNYKIDKNKVGDKEEDIKGIVKSLNQTEERDYDRKEKVGKSDRNRAKPVVRLQSQSDEDGDAIERNTENILDEFQEFKRDKDLKDLKMLEQLKTDIAAKAKEKIKTIEKMAASTSSCSTSNTEGEVSDKSYKRTVSNSLNDFLTAHNVAPAVVATNSPSNYNSIPNSPPGAIYPQTLEEIKKEQEYILQLTETSSHIENKNSNNDNEMKVNSKTSVVNATGHALLLSPTANSLHSNLNLINKERDRKRERDIRDRERETNYFNNDRYLDRRQRSSPNFFSTGGCGSGGSTGSIVGGRRNINNSNMLNINHRHQRLNLICTSGGVGAHHQHSHTHPHHHHPNHKIINNHHSTTSTIYIANNSSTNPHTLICNHSNNSTNISFHRPARINNTPLITATQFNNQMLSKQSNSILVNRRDHRTALNLGLSGTPCTNFSNSNLLLTKANNNPHHLHASVVGHVVGGGHHHQYHHHHHHHHHGQSTSMSSGGSNPATQITDRILMAASIAAAQRHSLGVLSTSSAAAVAAANNLNFLQQQNKPKLVIKPFKINDSQPLVAALADSSLVDAIVSKVSTATVAAAESAARRSRSRSRRSQSRNRHKEKTSSAERDGNRRRSITRSRSSRSSTSSRSRSRTNSHRSLRSRSSQSSSSSHTSSRSSSSSSVGSSRSGTRSPSIPRRRGSPSFLDRRRITSARKRPIPYHRKLPSDVSSCNCSSCCSRDSSPRSRSPSRDSRSPSRCF